MEKVTQNISLDVTAKTTPIYVYAKQYDNMSRYVCVTLTKNGVKVKVDTGLSAMVRARKPDGTSVANPATINSDGTVTAELTDQMLACEGLTKADISIYSGESVLSTASFMIDVDGAPLSPNKVTSSNEFLELTQAVEAAKAATKAAQEAAGKAPYIQDGAWMVWSAKDGKYVASGQVTGPQGKQGPKGEPGKDGVQIDDETANGTDTWSSKHIQNEITSASKIHITDTDSGKKYVAELRVKGGKPVLVYDEE